MINQLKDLGRLRFELEKDESAAPMQPSEGYPLIATFSWNVAPGLNTCAGWRTFQATDGSYGIIPQGTVPPQYANITVEYEFGTWIEAVNFIKSHLPCDEVAQTYESY